MNEGEPDSRTREKEGFEWVSALGSHVLEPLEGAVDFLWMCW